MPLTEEEVDAILAALDADGYVVLHASDVENGIRAGYDRALEDAAEVCEAGGTEEYTQTEWGHRKDCAEAIRALKHTTSPKTNGG